MEKKLVFMFSGQGSQFFHMGRVLYDADPVFRDTMTRMDGIAGEMIGRSVVEGIYDPKKNKGDRFDWIALSHPAIFMIEAALARTLAHRGIVPDYIVGASMGEFVAAGLYGMMDFDTAFRTILRQTIVFRGALEKGGMIAVMDSPDLYENTPLLRENSEISAVNFDGHFVVSAQGRSLETVGAWLHRSGINHFVLPVEYAFHSSHLDRIREKFINLYSGPKFRQPGVSFHSCAHAREIHTIDPDYFWRVIRRPIRFSDTIAGLASKGPCIFVDIGPSGTLATFAKYNLPKDSPSETWPILTPFGHEMDNFNRILGLQQPARPREKAPPAGAEPGAPPASLRAKDLGSHAFKSRFNLDYACLAGGMFQGISSARLVARMGNAGMMGFFGTHGLALDIVDVNITAIRREIDPGRAFGMNLSAGPGQDALVDLFLERDIPCIESSGFVRVTPALVKYRAAGMGKDPGRPKGPGHRIIAKLSRPEVAEHFLNPPPEKILDRLVASGEISAAQAGLARQFPMADAVCVTADCGGRTDRGTAATLLPVMMGLRDRIRSQQGYTTHVFIGAAGGIGTPEAAAAAFVLGAEFILTGSINQCTPEAGTSDRAKEMLQQVNVQDTACVPCSDEFETGAVARVMSKGVFFPARANRLFSLYQQYNSLDEIPGAVLRQISEKYFDLGLESVYDDCISRYTSEEIERARNSPKSKMALTFKWYLDHAVSLALAGQDTGAVNYQVYCGPCLGAFNQWVAGTGLENWQTRRVDVINKKILGAAADLLTGRFQSLARRDRALEGS